MKIYQVYEYGGEWEDSYNDVIATYTTKEAAEECRKYLEIREKKYVEKAEFCNKCPLYMVGNQNIKKYCADYEQIEGDTECANEAYLYGHITNYSVKEFDVQEKKFSESDLPECYTYEV